MVESYQKGSKEYYLKINKEALMKNPFFEFNIDDVNWAMIGSFTTFKELFDSMECSKEIKRALKAIADELFRIGDDNDGSFQREKNIWFYKYFMTLMLMDSKAEANKKIKEELINRIFEIVKDKEENYSLMKVIKVFGFININLLALNLAILVKEQVKTSEEKTKTTVQKLNDGSDSDRSDCSGHFEELISKTEEIIKKDMPDYHPLRVSLNIMKGLSKIFNEKICKSMEEVFSKDESMENLMGIIESTKNLLGFSGNDDENIDDTKDDDIESEGSYEVYKKFSKVFKGEFIKKDEVDTIKKAFIELDIQDLVFKATFGFSNEKTMKDYDSD